MKSASRRAECRQSTLRLKCEHQQGCDLPRLTQKFGYEAK
jgi:hypothetical protein